jgi:hypothetical protein
MWYCYFILDSCSFLMKFITKTCSASNNKNTSFNCKLEETPINTNKIPFKHSNSLCSRLVSYNNNPANASNIAKQNTIESKGGKSRNSKIKSLNEEIQSKKFLTSRNPINTQSNTGKASSVNNKNGVSNFQKYILNVKSIFIYRANLLIKLP